MIIEGVVLRKYGNDVNTDDIIPAYCLQESFDKGDFYRWAFEKFDPRFREDAKKSDANIIVADDNFGCGSSREHAVYAIQYSKVVAVIAKSFPDIFYRNSLNNGLPLFVFPYVSEIGKDNKLVINPAERKIKNLTDGSDYSLDITEEDLDLIMRGGVVGIAQKRLREMIKG